MEKSRLGRGLEDITDIFISQQKDVSRHQDVSVHNVKDVIGGYYPSRSRHKSLGRESSSEDENLDGINNSVTAKENRSDSYNHPEQRIFNRETQPDNERTKIAMESDSSQCEIIEHISRKKEIAYPATDDAQLRLREKLTEYLDDNFNIRLIELEKKEEMSQSGMHQTKQDLIRICMKDLKER